MANALMVEDMVKTPREMISTQPEMEFMKI
jgi:hypothetical protein